MTLENNCPVVKAMFFGWKRLCPKCGQGVLIKPYLKVRSKCNVCYQEFHHQRADDGPAYLVVLLLGHLLVPLLLISYEYFHLDPLIMASGLSIIAFIFTLYLLPRIKGALIGLQWAKHMHGF